MHESEKCVYLLSTTQHAMFPILSIRSRKGIDSDHSIKMDENLLDLRASAWAGYKFNKNIKGTKRRLIWILL